MQIYRDYSGQLNPNCYTKGRDGKSALVLVCHNTAGPSDFNPGNQALSDAAARYLTSNDRQVSIHWVVGAEAAGAPIYRVVPEDSIAYHAGGTPPQFPSRWVNPDDGSVYGRYGLNQVSIGIELFGNEKDPVGPNQLAALKALVLDIARRFPIIARPGHIVAHAELEGDRTDGKNWVNLAKGWVAQISSGGNAPQGVPTLDNTDPNGDPGVWHCTLTDKWVTNDEGFLSFHRQHGGVLIFGLPITGAYTDPTNPGQVIQWFERARFERHADGSVQLGLVGTELHNRL